MLAGFALAGGVRGQDASALARVDDPDAAIEAYARGARLALAGEVPLQEQKARKLAADIAARGNWFAVVVARSSGTGRGTLEALAPASSSWAQKLGKELRAKTSFGEDPLDSIFLITLEPRGLRLLLGTGFTAHDISEGDASLIEPARSALRDGLRIDDAVRDTIERIEARRRASARLPWLIGGGAGLGFAGLLAAGAVARRRKRRRAIQRYDEWSKIFDAQQGALVELKRWGAILSQNPRYRGRTKELAESIVEDVQHVALIRGGALEALDQAKQLIWPSGSASAMNLVTGWRYAKALEVMSRAKVRFNADGDLARALRGEPLQGGELESIWTGAKKVRRESRTFDELIEELNTRAQRVDSVVKHIQKCAQIVESTLGVFRARIERFTHAAREFETLTQNDPDCGLPQLRSTLLPAFEAEYERMVSIADPDPVTAVDGSDAAELRLQRGEELLEDLVQVLSDAVPRIRDGRSSLEAGGVHSPWVDRSVRSLFETADRWFATLARADDIPDPPHIFDHAAKTLESVGRAMEIARSRREKGLPELDLIEAETARERQTIASRLGVAELKVLREDDANPDDYLTRAREQFDESVLALGDGKLDEAFDLVTSAHREMDAARRILVDTRAALARHDERDKDISTRAEDLVSEAIPTHSALLDALEAYADSALRRDDQEDHSDGSLRTSVREASDQHDFVLERLRGARELHRDGRILQADHDLDRADAHLELAGLRLRELRERHATLKHTEGENERVVATLGSLVRELALSEDQVFVTRKTTAKIDEASAAYHEAASRPQVDRDPFLRATRLERARALLHAARSGIEADRAARAEAVRSLDLARDMVRRAFQRATDAQRDEVPDSERIDEIVSGVPRLERTLDELASLLETPHQDWIALDERIDAVHAHAFELESSLDREIERGRAALRDVKRAGEAVREAAAFADSTFGLRLPGSPGRSAHVRAKRRLERGDYDGATTASRSALREARDAIASARRARDPDTTRGASVFGGSWNAPGGLGAGLDIGNLARDIFREVSEEWSAHRRYRGSVQIPQVRRAPDLSRRRREGSSRTSSSAPSSAPTSSSGGDTDDSGFGPSFDW